MQTRRDRLIAALLRLSGARQCDACGAYQPRADLVPCRTCGDAVCHSCGDGEACRACWLAQQADLDDCLTALYGGQDR